MWYYFIFVYIIFMSQIVLYFLHSILVLSFYIDVVLTLSICISYQLEGHHLGKTLLMWTKSCYYISLTENNNGVYVSIWIHTHKHYIYMKILWLRHVHCYSTGDTTSRTKTSMWCSTEKYETSIVCLLWNLTRSLNVPHHRGYHVSGYQSC